MRQDRCRIIVPAPRPMRLRRGALAATLAFLAAGVAAVGPTSAPAPATERKPARPAPPRSAAPSAAAALPASIEQMLYLIRSTLLTLNDANHSGNYSVLRDLAAPDFQARNSAADLALSFTDLRRRNFDLFAVALLAPRLTATPALDAKGMLHLAGLFPTRPLQIGFDLTFETVGGTWRLFAISITTPEAPAQAEASVRGAH